MSAPNIEPNNQANNAGFPPAPPEDSSNRQGWKVEKRKFFVPGGFIPVELEGELPEGVEVWRDPVRAVAVGFSGKRGKPDWYYRFPSEERMQRHVDDWIKRIREAEEWKAKRRAEAKAKAAQGHGCKVGDIFRCSWGYEQTNVDYYQITELHGRTMATVRRIAAQAEENGWLRGDCAPAPGRFLDEDRYPAMRVKINTGETPSFRAYSFASAYLMKPTVEVEGVKTYNVDYWSAYH